MTMPTRLAVLLCRAGILGLAGCAGLPAQHGPGVTITVSQSGNYRPPAGAVPAALSAQPGNYDYSGIVRIIDSGQVVAPADELNRLNLSYALLVGQIRPVANPTPARLHIVVPDHDRLRLLALQATRGVQNGVTEFRAEVQRLQLHETADAVVRSGAFTSADITEQNDTVWPDAAGADDVLWFEVQSARANNAGPWVGSWQLRQANGATPLAVSFDPGTAPGPKRFMSFISSVQDDAATLGGHPVSTPDLPRPHRSGHPVGQGSGIVIDTAGHVLTDSHVVAACPDIRVTTAGRTVPVGARLVANDVKLDLALLNTGEHTRVYARFRDSKTLRPGEPLVATGFPLGGVVSPEMAVTTGSLTTLSGLQGDPRTFQFSAPIQPGNSGGPVLDSSGRVAGIATSVLSGLAFATATGGPLLQNINFATKADVARDYLAGMKVSLDEHEGGPSGLDAASIGDAARGFTTKVECWR